MDTVVPDRVREVAHKRGSELAGSAMIVLGGAIALALATWSVDDPSFNHATDNAAENILGAPGAILADLLMQLFGLASIFIVVFALYWGIKLLAARSMPSPIRRTGIGVLALLAGATAMACLPTPASWPLPTHLGGYLGDLVYGFTSGITGQESSWIKTVLAAFVSTTIFAWFATRAFNTTISDLFARPDLDLDDYEDEADLDEDEYDDREAWIGAAGHMFYSFRARIRRLFGHGGADFEYAHAPTAAPQPRQGLVRRLLSLLFGGQESAEFADYTPLQEQTGRIEPVLAGHPGSERGYDDWADPIAYPEDEYSGERDDMFDAMDAPEALPQAARVQAPAARPKPGSRISKEAQPSLLPAREFVLPPLRLLTKPANISATKAANAESLEQNARMLESVLDDYGVKGEIINVCPGPVVTLYELEPAPGIKSARVIGLADDIARSMSAVSARIAVIPGRNAIGIELPNSEREIVFLRELLASENFERSKSKLPLALGKTIGGESVIADLSRMPHLLIAGTTGSGKSVGINAMILSLLYRLPPDQCKLIMIDPKMLELSVYDGIPHLLSPVVTDPKKAVVALKWTVREMEDRYKKMSKLGVRNMEGFNQRVAQAKASGEVITRTVQTGFDRETGKAIYETEEMDLEPMPFIVVIVDEMADLMMVAGKDIEGTIQRLAQMARAAGIHIITATQRPSVDVITGTIKANFPTRISFQVTSKIDSRTILGEQGAEQLLGQGDMLHMAGGGRISRVHGAFVSDGEVERIVSHLKKQGVPEYLDVITEEVEESAFETGSPMLEGGEGDELYNKAVNIVLNDKKVSTSYIQRRLSIGYNRAATIIEQMEAEGLISEANHAGKREILVGDDA